LSTSWEQAVRTHPVDKLLKQHCYKSAAGLSVDKLLKQHCYKSAAGLSVDKLLKQHCYKSAAAGLLKLVRFSPISTQENLARTENVPKISLLKVENFLFSARRQLFHKPVNLIKCILGD
jgi:hypothetical protein